MEHFDVEPDLMIVAKSIAGGLPLSGVIGRAEIMDDPHPGAIGGTFIGNPGCARGRVRRARRVRRGAARRACADPRRRDPRADARMAVPLAADRGRSRARRDARDRARRDPATKKPAPELDGGGRRRGPAARAAAPEGGRQRQLHPRALPAHDLGGASSTTGCTPGKRRSAPCSGSSGRRAWATLPPCPPRRNASSSRCSSPISSDRPSVAEGRTPSAFVRASSASTTLCRRRSSCTGGTVEKFAGDAVMAVFGAPAALEDHAERALNAGVGHADAPASALRR